MNEHRPLLMVNQRGQGRVGGGNAVAAVRLHIFMATPRLPRGNNFNKPGLIFLAG